MKKLTENRKPERKHHKWRVVPSAHKGINMKEKLPDFLEEVIKEYPEVWKAYQAFGEACSQAGPLDENTVRSLNLRSPLAQNRRERYTRTRVVP